MVETRKVRDHSKEKGLEIAFDKEQLRTSLGDDVESVIIQYLDGKVVIKNPREAL